MERRNDKHLSTSTSTSSSSSTSAVNLRSASHSAIAGYVAGIAGVIMGHPLDSIKVWIQTNSSGQNKHLVEATTTSTSTSTSAGIVAEKMPPLHISYTHTLRRWIQTVRALYSGVSGPLVTTGLIQSLNLMVYDSVRRLLHRQQYPQASPKDYLTQDSLWNVWVAGLVAGSGRAFLTAPLMLVKTRQQVTGEGFREAFEASLWKGGRFHYANSLVGIYPHLVSVSMGLSMYYTTYEFCKRKIVQYKPHDLDQPATVNVWERMGSAGAAGILCWALIYPFDSVRNRLYTQAVLRASTNVPLLNTWQMTKLMYSEGALYKGFSLTILRAGPVAAAVLPVYDWMLEQLTQY